jgi:hypothetical protein
MIISCFSELCNLKGNFYVKIAFYIDIYVKLFHFRIYFYGKRIQQLVLIVNVLVLFLYYQLFYGINKMSKCFSINQNIGWYVAAFYIFVNKSLFFIPVKRIRDQL